MLVTTGPKTLICTSVLLIRLFSLLSLFLFQTVSRFSGIVFRRCWGLGHFIMFILGIYHLLNRTFQPSSLPSCRPAFGTLHVRLYIL